MSNATANGPPALKDPDKAHPIPGVWRPMLCAVVQCFVEVDYGLSRGVVCVEPIAAATAEQIRNYIVNYGATLVELPEDAWETSVAQWMGTHWQILVALWTAEEGRSDLVLDGNVVETSEGPRLTIHLVCVP
jgi:hypothetical protein